MRNVEYALEKGFWIGESNFVMRYIIPPAQEDKQTSIKEVSVIY